MPRARLLKPGFFKNEELLDLPFEGRLLFAGLWTLADRSGHLEDRPKRIKIELFPADDVDVDALLERLNARGFIHRYIVGSVALIHIPSFPKHQSPHKNEPASTLPACDCESLGEAPVLDGDGPYVALAPEPHHASTVQAPESPDAAQQMSGARPADNGNRYTDNSLSERAPKPLKPPKKTVPTEEWAAEMREKYPLRDFDGTLAFHMNGSYYRGCADKCGFLEGKLKAQLQRDRGLDPSKPERRYNREEGIFAGID